MKVALIADWLVSYGGAEEVMIALSEIFPDAPIYTSIYNSKKLPQFKDKKIITSFLQNLPGAQTHHQYYWPLMPKAFASFDLSQYDLVISSCHSFAKGIKTLAKTFHVCYCYTPTRYLWFPEIDRRISGKSGLIFSLLAGRTKNWDKAAASRVNQFIAISRTVQKRIKKVYNRDSYLIYSPIDISQFKLSQKIGQYYLTGGRLIPYKRIDLVVKAFNRLGLPLKIMGSGPDLTRLKKLAKKNIEFLGFVSDAKRAELFSECLAFIFPGEEDLGLTPLEAMASGRPVIAYGTGGAAETVIATKTGELFKPQTVNVLVAKIKNFQPTKFKPQVCREWAEKFDVKIFKQKIKNYIEKEYNQFKKINKGE